MPSPRQPAANRASLAGALLLLLSLAWCAYWFVHGWHYWEDDAWIHLEFARSLAAGQGFAFNGRVVAGDTAPLWVFLLVAVHAVVPRWILAGKALAALGAIFGLAGCYAFARSLAARLLPPSDAAAKIFPAAAAVFFLAVNPYTCYWIFSGMESVAAAGLACFAVLAATRSRPTYASFVGACLLAGIAPLLRPETIFLTALLAIPLLGQWRRLSGSAVLLLIGLVLAAAPLALWSAYSLHAFGHILPNTNAAKRAGPHDSVLVRLASAYSLGYPIVVAGALALAAALLLRARALARSLRNAVAEALGRTEPSSPGLPFAAWIFILWPVIAAVFYVINHTYVQTRYILVPAFGLSIVILLLALRSSPRGGRILYLAALAWSLVLSLVVVRPFIRNKGVNCDQVAQLADFIRDHIPANQPVATYSIGEITYLSQHAIVDTGGITRPEAIPYINSPDLILRWARLQGARYYTSGSSPQPGSVAVYVVHTPFTGWSLHPGRYATMDQFSLWRLPPGPDLPAAAPAPQP